MKKVLLTTLVGVLSVSMALAAAVDGKKLFVAKCASCHGLDGKGKAAIAKMKKVDPSALDMTKEATAKKPLADLVKTASEGTGKMPSMKTKMTPAEIEASVKYLLTLGTAKK